MATATGRVSASGSVHGGIQSTSDSHQTIHQGTCTHCGHAGIVFANR